MRADSRSKEVYRARLQGYADPALGAALQLRLELRRSPHALTPWADGTIPSIPTADPTDPRAFADS
ncbi:hypothetical protein [Pseudactinotalea suaedae]|uniref:hypothetical protein n=1 Tax=Pseudactinotalea suaedae TaxID=1524924 RepID=UPI0012E1DB5F|nr:hypothetical protein [Pseudactinotalea suaedae]